MAERKAKQMKTYQVTVSRPIFGHEQTTVTIQTDFDPLLDQDEFDETAFDAAARSMLWTVAYTEPDYMGAYEIDSWEVLPDTVQGQEKLDL